ncbi:MAG: hypothetical protein H8E44_20610 [Planctomycetes bacterium]|nr:hypothetical protein [Planctomycetota bacterium]MBL7039685.1 hypothetical protein [Pirellulaceae bacterium]
MNKYHEQSSAPTAAMVIVVVLVLAVVLLAGCAFLGLMFYRNTTHKAMVAREHALKAEAQARKAAEMARERAEQAARVAEQQARIVAEEVSDTATNSGVTELQVTFDAEGHMSVAGEAIDWEQVKDKLGQLAGQPPSRVVILADGQTRMEPILKLLKAARELEIETSISTSHPEAEEAE